MAGGAGAQAKQKGVVKCFDIRLKVLVPACSANADKELKKKLGSAERILKLGELCRKLETEQEKVLPFCSPEQALGLQPQADQEGKQGEGEASATGLEESDHQV